MPPMTLISTVLITLALVFYTTGVWAERIARYLKPWHVAAFWVGFLFDTSGTIAMDLIEPGVDWLSAHTITGQLALWLMFGHAVWATVTVRKGTDEARAGFHRLSLVVWLFWLVPYFGGMYLGMRA
jgi:uncharacterized repeat protein (TIGR03987 family)